MTVVEERPATGWVTCKNGPWYPSLSHGGYVAYRIWHRQEGAIAHQRHEWRRADGSIQIDEWIPTNTRRAEA